MTANQFREHLADKTLPGPADCIVTRRGQFTIRHFPRVSEEMVADHLARRGRESAEETLRRYRREQAEMFNG